MRLHMVTVGPMGASNGPTTATLQASILLPRGGVPAPALALAPYSSGGNMGCSLPEISPLDSREVWSVPSNLWGEASSTVRLHKSAGEEYTR